MDRNHIRRPKRSTVASTNALQSSGRATSPGRTSTSGDPRSVALAATSLRLPSLLATRASLAPFFAYWYAICCTYTHVNMAPGHAGIS